MKETVNATLPTESPAAAEKQGRMNNQATTALNEQIIKRWNAKEISIDRACELASKIALQLDDDEAIAWFSELLAGFCLSADETQDKQDYHHLRALFSLSEVYKHTSDSTNALADYLVKSGFAEEEQERGKAVTQ